MTPRSPSLLSGSALSATVAGSVLAGVTVAAPSAMVEEVS
jgi:hypothetical protein